MAKGTINKWFKDKQYGFIRVDGMRADAHFRSSEVQGISTDELREGLAVSFEVERNGDRLRAKHVTAAGKPKDAKQEDYRFINPYNFVRFLESPKSDSGEAKLMGRCEPPPHDRWVGLTGHIVCELDAVTPLFVSDSENITVNGEHNTFRFFHFDFGDGRGLRG